MIRVHHGKPQSPWNISCCQSSRQYWHAVTLSTVNAVLYSVVDFRRTVNRYKTEFPLLLAINDSSITSTANSFEVQEYSGPAIHKIYQENEKLTFQRKTDKTGGSPKSFDNAVLTKQTSRWKMICVPRSRHFCRWDKPFQDILSHQSSAEKTVPNKKEPLPTQDAYSRLAIRSCSWEMIFCIMKRVITKRQMKVFKQRLWTHEKEKHCRRQQQVGLVRSNSERQRRG